MGWSDYCPLWTTMFLCLLLSFFVSCFCPYDLLLILFCYIILTSNIILLTESRLGGSLLEPKGRVNIKKSKNKRKKLCPNQENTRDVSKRLFHIVQEGNMVVTIKMFPVELTSYNDLLVYRCRVFLSLAPQLIL